MKPAFIHNPNSRKNRIDGEQFLSKAKNIFGDFCIRSHHDEHLVRDMRALYEQGVTTIVINGGDGTVSGCLTAIESVYPKENLPNIAVIPSGNTNLIAGDVGFGKRGTEALDRLFKPQSLAYKRRSPLRLSWPGDDRTPVLGMFGGCTGYARAVRIAHSPTVLKFAPHDLAVFLTILSSVASLFIKKSRQKWLNGNKLSWSAQTSEGLLTHDDASFLFLATGLEKISHGIWPFWSPGGNAKGFHFLNVSCFPANLPSAICNLLRGKAPQWLRQHPDYISQMTTSMSIETDSDFVLDGEVFHPPSDSKLLLEQGPSFRFLHV
ncbi:hypothetical protein GT348_04300 [Aristophania vespae]|uniref:DAGKc domain-containing protein n=1 Tax=Aristophania vespae TaxID=2697033 RepID=A0A6P1NDN3_9PROT|nr:acylglycerol kinase family protein [Aristophania vespae]QHI95589.1 hypothetical protein GT348_04300 [Aristophania vespae]UMM63257.1 hypothetical protein DM15PD_02150 [Aristophania vespae]